MKQWNRIFKKQGKFFFEPQEDIPGLVKLFKKKGVKKVLDLGCGSGRHTVYLAKNGFDVYGIDVARKGIEITKAWLKKEKLKADLKIGDIYEKLPYPNDFFNALISTQTLHHNRVENIRKLIKEIERILRPKGLIFITVSRKRTKKEMEKILKPKEKIWKLKIIAPRTIIPLSGNEKGLIHYCFNERILKKEFRNFRIDDIWIESKRGHYCLLGELIRGGRFLR